MFAHNHASVSCYNWQSYCLSSCARLRTQAIFAICTSLSGTTIQGLEILAPFHAFFVCQRQPHSFLAGSAGDDYVAAHNSAVRAVLSGAVLLRPQRVKRTGVPVTTGSPGITGGSANVQAEIL